MRGEALHAREKLADLSLSQESSGEIFYVRPISPSSPLSSDAQALPQRLKKQCENLDLPLIAPPAHSSSSFPMAADAQDVAFRRAMENTDVVLDCVFGACAPASSLVPFLPLRRGGTDGRSLLGRIGFSFQPPARAPFITVLEEFKKTTKPILSVDIPSGWDVVDGNPGDGFTPGASACSLLQPHFLGKSAY